MFNGRSGAPGTIGKAEFWIETKSVIESSVYVSWGERPIDHLRSVLMGGSECGRRVHQLDVRQFPIAVCIGCGRELEVEVVGSA